MAGMVVITTPGFSSYCSCWTSGTGCLQLSFVLCCSSYFALSRFAVLWFALPVVGYALLLPAVHSALVLLAIGFALVPAVGFALLHAVFIVAPDVRCSYRCPRTRVALLRSSHHLLLGCGSFSDSLTTGSFGCGSFCAFSSESFSGKSRRCAHRD